MSSENASAYLRIGELSRRVGVGVESLRAWERRYGLLSPSRTAGGFRLYGDRDLRRVELMLEHLNAGVSTAEAARLALEDRPPDGEHISPDTPPLERVAGELRRALDAFDDEAAQAAFDGALAAFALHTVLRDLLLPYLHELGERWARGEASVAQEHFASALIRGRLLGLARGWGDGAGPRALLACAPGEGHDIGLICFGLALRTRGWRITYLGPDTPIESLADTAARLEPALVVVHIVTATPAEKTKAQLAAVSRSTRLALAGPVADADLARHLGAELLTGDPVAASRTLDPTARPPAPKPA